MQSVAWPLGYTTSLVASSDVTVTCGAFGAASAGDTWGHLVPSGAPDGPTDGPIGERGETVAAVHLAVNWLTTFRFGREVVTINTECGRSVIGWQCATWVPGKVTCPACLWRCGR